MCLIDAARLCTENPGKRFVMNKKIWTRGVLLLAAVITITGTSSYLRADTGTCGGASITLPFTDVSASNVFFCSIAGAYFAGLTNGTSPTTYGPSEAVTREQMAAFITRTLNQALMRGNRRAALNQWAVPTAVPFSAKTAVGNHPCHVASDGADLWVANENSNSVSRVRASDGKLLETWSGAYGAYGVLVARGRIFVTGYALPGAIYQIDPRQPAGAVSTLATILDTPLGITTDGFYIWTANSSASVSKVNPDTGDVTTYALAGANQIFGMLFDGTYIWVATDDSLKKLSSTGTVLESIAMNRPQFPIFDGMNIWVPDNVANTVYVVRAIGTSATGSARVLKILTGNGLNGPVTAAFDGERVAVTNMGGDCISVWSAADLTPIGFYSAGPVDPWGICSDGTNFWITFQSQAMLARF